MKTTVFEKGKEKVNSLKKGATALVAGSYVFSSNDMKEAIASLR